MSGDRRKRKNTLEYFISALVKKREEFRREKKTGAGCATEAVEFYQYVLDKNTTWKAKAGKKGKDSSPESESPAGEDEEEFLNDHNDVCEVCATGGELLCCSTCNLVFHLNCVRPALKSMPSDSWSCAHCDGTGVTGLKKDSRQRKRAVSALREMEKLHTEMKAKKSAGVPVDGKIEAVVAADTTVVVVVKTADEPAKLKTDAADIEDGACKVCSYGGDLFSCSQEVCNNKFHVACARPAIDVKPDANWNCAYCDVDFITGLKPQARKRRAALSGVRAMDKTKTEYDAKRKDNILPAASAPTTPSTSNPNKRTFDEANDLAPINLAPIDLTPNDLTPIDLTSPVHPGQPRSQRIRRQIVSHEEKEKIAEKTIATPEKPAPVPVVPAAPLFTRADIPPDLLKKLSPKSTNSNSRHGQYNCKFCMDDEKTETCCFCACRICFTKHGKSNIILCDLCDGEYHMYCLSPPLAEVPSFDWFCPTCTDAISKDRTSVKGAKASVGKPVGKKSGKSKGSGKSASQIAFKKGATKAKAKLALKQKKAAYSAQQPRTNAGRFATKGNKAPSSPASSPAVPLVKKRGPGRPPKSAAGPGRPPKKAGFGGPGRPPKKAGFGGPGRPPKSVIKAALLQKFLAPSGPDLQPMFSSTGGMMPSFTEQRSRSGRVVKRKAAYDEREEGDQLLKSTTNTDAAAKEDSKLPSQLSEVVNNVSSKTMPSEAAILAAKSAAVSAIINIPNISAGKTVAMLQLQVPTYQHMPTSSVSSPTNLLDQHFQPVAGLKTEPLPSPKSNSNMRPNLSPTVATPGSNPGSSSKNPRRKPGARECMQISRRFGAGVIQQNYMDILMVSCFEIRDLAMMHIVQHSNQHLHVISIGLLFSRKG